MKYQIYHFRVEDQVELTENLKDELDHKNRVCIFAHIHELFDVRPTFVRLLKRYFGGPNC